MLFRSAFDQLSEDEKRKLLNLVREGDEGVADDEEEESAPAQEKKMDDSLYEIDLNELKKELAAVASPGKPAAGLKAAPKAAPPMMGGMKKKPVAPSPFMDEMDFDDEGALDEEYDDEGALDEEYDDEGALDEEYDDEGSL